MTVVQGLGWPTTEDGSLVQVVEESPAEASLGATGWMVPRETAKE